MFAVYFTLRPHPLHLASLEESSLDGTVHIEGWTVSNYEAGSKKRKYQE